MGSGLTETVVSLDEAKNMLEHAKSDWNQPKDIDPKAFQQVANGFFQGEGSVTARFKNGTVLPVVSLNQNFSQESLVFFVTLWHFLGQNGNLFLSLSASGKWVIILRTENWQTILNVYAPYFNMCYGEKYIGFLKLAEIRALMGNFQANLLEIAKLIYSMALSGVSRKTPITDLLASFNVEFDGNNQPSRTFNDNPLVPTVLFMIGFLIADGTLFLRLRFIARTGAIQLIPLLLLPQLNTQLNAHFMSQLSALLKSLGVNYSLRVTSAKSVITAIETDLITDSDKERLPDTDSMTSSMIILSVEGIYNIFNILLPLFTQYSNYFYWKRHQYELMYGCAPLILAGAHLTRWGLNLIIDICYSFYNKRSDSKEYWLNNIAKYFAGKDAKCISGHQMIEPARGRGITAGEIIAWRVVIPDSLTLKLPNKVFSIAKYGSSEDALLAAISYRDSVMQDWVKSL